MRAGSTSAKVVVTFEPRIDGGLRAYSDDVPGFVLSHSNPAAVMADVEPALETILSVIFGADIYLSELVSVRSYQAGGESANARPREITSREYVGLKRATL